MLQVEDIKVKYSSIEVLHGISIRLMEGQTVCVLGSNGAGKSTLLKAIGGVVRISNGRIIFKGKPIHTLRTEVIVRLGIVYVPEAKMLFGPLSVEENLLLGAYVLRDEDRIKQNLESVYELFPVLKDRRYQSASTLSGGEQQMVAIGRGLMSNPKLLMLDEPSLGLAPFLVDEVMDTVRKLKEEGNSILLVEQNVREALDISDYAYVIQTGRIMTQGKGRKLLQEDVIKRAYMGL
ncbi:MAG: branched-chain amino acid ABC transporter ATP-binding protein [Deltaproteobacteria bacterium]|nr:MAG: branched-chain amino acid ABC transporter ATP-binding protein [Deltaproteobacteria bacterium]